MMHIWLQCLSLGMCMLPLLLALQRGEQLALHAHAAWTEDYEQVLCGRWQAFARNLEAGKSFLADSLPSAAHDPRLGELAASARQIWEPRHNGSTDFCAEKTAALVYQYNAALPAAYPNWWVLWPWPETLSY